MNEDDDDEDGGGADALRDQFRALRLAKQAARLQAAAELGRHLASARLTIYYYCAKNVIIVSAAALIC
jgi:hypothetical protein